MNYKTYIKHPSKIESVGVLLWALLDKTKANLCVLTQKGEEDYDKV